MENILINIDGKEYLGSNDETIYQVAKRNKIEIPTLCNDERLKPYSSCYVCVVEIDGIKNLQPSCSTLITNGMKIFNSTDKVKKARKTALDLLVSNHYADCLGPCKITCPAGVDVQGYVSLIEKGLYKEALELIKEVNPLPAICGRVCVRPCEFACRRNLVGEGSGAGVDYLKRFVADKDLFSEDRIKPKIADETGKKIAIIGAGPGGLSAAYFLRIKGHQCDIYEANPNPGGWLRYGIPEYRLPNDILDKEIDLIKELGVNIYCNKKLGENLFYKDLKLNYDAVILTIGSQKGTKIGCEGDDAHNVFSGIDFLRNMEITQIKPDLSGKVVVTVGGGNTAMDCCRTAFRLGAKKSIVVYRRTEKEMPANPIEIHESKIEGVEYLFLNNPIKVNKNDVGSVKSLTLIKMALGEPDSSGRRRPVEVSGSEYELECDLVLAAIGQKTDVDFIDDINKYSEEGEFKINKWGDIDVDRKTLQTGIKSIFAAGDGVSGPATIIEAIAQAKVAATSCHQFLLGEEIKPLKKEFLSRKDNFEDQSFCDYSSNYEKRYRQEMPILEAQERHNFNEVELGYKEDETAINETSRCLECGCVEYFTCDLKKYADEYEAEQNVYKGEFKKYDINYSHPYIEIDNNKCILCSKCVRICKEHVGANALALLNRGFDSFVAPADGISLENTNCESCGMCIEICPTGAITENVPFKPGPIELNKFKTICNHCSIGCEIELNHKSDFVMKINSSNGYINKDAEICKYGKFDYHFINRKDRIKKPLLKKDGKFNEISIEQAATIIKESIDKVKPDENMIFAGSKMTNEDLFLVQTLARKIIKTNNLASYQNLNKNLNYNIPIDYTFHYQELEKVSKVYLIGADLVETHPVVSYKINKLVQNNIEVIEITEKSKTKTENKVTETLKLKSYYHFIKAVNYYIIKSESQNGLYLVDHCDGFDEYKASVLNENYEEHILKSGLSKAFIEKFADDYDEEQNAVIITSENELSSEAIVELFNLALITGKLGKISNGILLLQENCNSQGLLDMGIYPTRFIGGVFIDNKFVRESVEENWNVKISDNIKNPLNTLFSGEIKNMFIFNEDPVGLSIDKEDKLKWIQSEFIVVQDSFMTATAKEADLIIPANFHFETGGSFTNTNRMIQQFEGGFNSIKNLSNKYILLDLINLLQDEKIEDTNNIFDNICRLLPRNSKNKFELNYTDRENKIKYFK